MRKANVTFLLCLLCLAASVLSPELAWSQQVTASITGRVTDPSNAPIAGATVTARDTERGTVWPTTTNGEGIYTLSRLPIGTYEVRVESKGFQTAVHPSITLELNQAARVDVAMTIGAVSETVEVTTAAPLLQTETTQLGTVLNANAVEAAPLATRNYIQLTLLAPGSINTNPEQMTDGHTSGGGSGRPMINGNREQANNFLLDGVDNNQVSDNLVGYAPSVDAIQEFNLITNNAPADFGNFQGGIVSVSIKSGTNNFHGNAFEFFRNDVLNANSWSNNFTGADRGKMRWNMFGGTFGGPIFKDKLFFFVDYQGQRFHFPASTSTLTVFTAAERQGDFSQLLREKGIQLYNPFNIVNGQRQPFANNQIPMSLISPVAQNLFNDPSLYPLPINGLLQNNELDTSRSNINGDQGDIKLDWNATEKDHVFTRFSKSQQAAPSFHSFPLRYGGFDDTPTEGGVVDWTHTFGASLVNEFRAGINYVLQHNGDSDNGLGDVAQKLGILNGNELGPGLLAINFNAAVVSGFGSSNLGTQQLFADTVLQFEDTVTLTRGRHAFHMGFQAWRQRLDTFYAGNNGRTGLMDFNGKYTAGPDPGAVASNVAGSGEADFFLGLPTILGRGVNHGTWGHRGSIFAGFVQDNWRVNNALTLNLGLRYETHTPWVEVFDRQANFAPFTGAIQLAGQSTIYSNNRALYNSYNLGLDFQPRIGFAWTPAMLGGHTVLRGAYTISSYLEGTGTNLRLPLNPPFNEEFETRYDNTNLHLPLSTTSDGLSVLSSPTDPFKGANIRLWDPNIMPSIAQQWNFAVQHQFADSMTAQAGYVGQHATHLMVPMPYFQRQLMPDGSTLPSPFLAGNPALANIAQISGTASNGNMRYDALQAVLQKRFSSGLQYQVAYTYSKCMTDSIGYYGGWGQASSTSAYWQNLYDQKAEWGPCFYDATQSLSSYALYQLPIGRHRAMGKGLNPFVNAIVGDWDISGVLQVHSGFPLTISAGDASGTNSRGARANCIAPPHVFGKQNSPAGGYQWFDPASYTAPDPHTFGDCGVGTVRGPGLTSFNFDATKEFLLTETKRLQFRSEFINLFNHPILNSPNTGLGSTLGLLQSSQGPRNIQFAMKFYF